MEAKSFISTYGEDHGEKFGKEYEYLSDVIYAKDVDIFNEIYSYLVDQSLKYPAKKITIEDNNIKEMLSASKELDPNFSDYKMMLKEWVDKYNEDYIDRFGGDGYKFYLDTDGEFILRDKRERDEKLKNKILDSIGKIKSSTGDSVLGLFRSVYKSDKIVDKHGNESWVKAINANLKKIAAIF